MFNNNNNNNTHTHTHIYRIMLEIKTILQKNLQTADVMSNLFVNEKVI